MGLLTVPVLRAMRGELEKLAESRLRSMIRILTEGGGAKADDLSQERWHSLLLNGRKIGRMETSLHPDGWRVGGVKIAPEFQGMGLGKKLYGEVMRDLPEGKLNSGSQVSVSADHLWGSLSRRPDAYTVIRNTEIEKIPEFSPYRGANGKRQDVWEHKYGEPVYQGQIRPEARRPVEKLAMNRVVRELLAKLTKSGIPETEVRSTYLRGNLQDLLNRLGNAGEDWKTRYREHLNPYGVGSGPLTAEGRAKARAITHEFDGRLLFEDTSLGRDLYQNSLRQAASGAHRPRADEVLVLAAPSGEQTLRYGSKQERLFFRGNEPTDVKSALERFAGMPETGSTFLTRHPEVASAYALGRAGGQTTPGSVGGGKLFAYQREGLPHVSEGPADRNFLRDPPKRAAETQKALSTPFIPKTPYLPGHLSPTYETAVLSEHQPELLKRQVGEYRVRPSRATSGHPAYAVKTVSGLPGRDVFAEHLVD